MGTTGLAIVLAGPTPQFIWPTLILVATLLIGAFIISLVERWRKRAPSVTITAGDQLTKFREMYDRGQITREEFEAIRAELADRIKAEAGIGVSPQAPGPPLPAAPPKPPETPRDGIKPADAP
jgi:hypothetical protein